jgi:acetolactate synthase-1/2/3 large subunit
MISAAFEEVKALAERMGCPVATTMTGKGIIEETHALSVGVAGSIGSPVANEILGEADLVVFIGAKTGQLATFGWDLPRPGIPTIHIDIDPEEIGRNYADSVPVVSDAKLGVAALVKTLGDDRPVVSWDQDDFSERIKRWYEQAVNKPHQDGEPLKAQAIMDVVNRYVTDDDVVVCDASLASGWAAVYYRLTGSGRRYIAPRGIAGLGWGAPAGIGAALAKEGKQRILVFAGDGGFAYSVQELEVMARLDLPVVSIIFNNDTLAWIKHVQEKRFTEGFISADFGHVDFATAGKGFGARGYSVRTYGELADALDKEQLPRGPAVIDIMADQWETPVLRFASTGGET